MPSTYTASLRIEMQAAGENLNTWGAPRLNNGLSRIDFAVAGLQSIALTGNYTLTSSNTSDDEARAAFLKFSGGGSYTVTIPSVSKGYAVWNTCTGALTLTTGAGATATIAVGEIVGVMCDGANVYKIKPASYDGAVLSGLGTPQASSDAATKGYVDGVAFNSTNLPGQGAGTVGQFIKSNGSVASWETITVSDVTGAAPTSAPSITDGLTLAGGATVTGATKMTPVTVPGLDIDWSAGEMQTKALASSEAITFSGFVAGKAQVLVLKLTISSSAAPAWPAAVTWDNGVDPDLPNGLNILGFTTFDGGATIEGYVLGEAFG